MVRPNGWAGVTVAILLAIVGITHVDREAIAFAVFFAIGVVLLVSSSQRGRAYTVTVVILGLLFADVAFWMFTATWSNLSNHEQLLYIVEPLALSCASAAGLIAVAGRLVDRRDRGTRKGATVVTVAALAIFILQHGRGRRRRLGKGTSPWSGRPRPEDP